MKSNNFLMRFALGAYLLIFFLYLLGPLLIMSITALNSKSFPSASPWECLTFEWFTVLAHDERILNGIKNSFIIGIGTVILSVSMGMAGSLVLTQIWPRLRSTYYTIIIAPILVPGVVLGISTLVFWDRVNRFFGLDNDSVFSDGLFLTIMGQSTFIASYCMLVFVARLQRFDSGLTEAALDLGASHVQAFRKIMLPFLRPAIASACVLAFLASFENYNTTTFTFGQYPTLTIELAQKVRYGINPSISALAFIIVALTVFAALANEAFRRRREIRSDKDLSAAAQKPSLLPGFLRGNIPAIVLVLFSFGVITVFYTAQTYSPEICKAEVKAEKKIETDLKIKAIQDKLKAQQQVKTQEQENIKASKKKSGGAFGSVFAPSNLEETTGTTSEPETKAPAKKKNNAFGNVFAPTNLEETTGTTD
ncbi:ABC transporter permease [Alphaproteobacteria bacterium]|jgi:spermidine/putrescine transport system permease protein|nr:ABC transporter permease [Alphaproteobacteria bacterium]